MVFNDHHLYNSIGILLFIAYCEARFTDRGLDKKKIRARSALRMNTSYPRQDSGRGIEALAATEQSTYRTILQRIRDRDEMKRIDAFVNELKSSEDLENVHTEVTDRQFVARVLRIARDALLLAEEEVAHAESERLVLDEDNGAKIYEWLNEAGTYAANQWKELVKAIRPGSYDPEMDNWHVALVLCSMSITYEEVCSTSLEILGGRLAMYNSALKRSSHSKGV